MYIFSAGKMDWVLNNENSFRCRGGGDGRMSVARLLRSIDGGLASRYCLSRMEAAQKLLRFLS